MRYPLLECLLRHLKMVQDDGFILKNMPESVKLRVMENISNSDDFTSWFREQYESTDDKKQIILLKDVYNIYKNSDMYFNLSKYEKRQMTYKYFISTVENNVILRKDYRERLNMNGTFFRKVLVGYQSNICQPNDPPKVNENGLLELPPFKPLN